MVIKQSQHDEMKSVASALRSRRGLAVVLSAPSGAGKTTVCEKLVAEEARIVKSVSFTTRLRRKGEIEGDQYYFVTRKRFQEERVGGRFLEWAEVHGYLYGTPRDYLERQLRAGKDVMLDIDVQGARTIKGAVPEAVLIFLLPPSLAELKDRLRRRDSDSTSDISARLRNATIEFGCYRMYDYLVVNEEVNEAARTVKSIIMAEKCREDRLESTASHNIK